MKERIRRLEDKQDWFGKIRPYEPDAIGYARARQDNLFGRRFQQLARGEPLDSETDQDRMIIKRLFPGWKPSDFLQVVKILERDLSKAESSRVMKNVCVLLGVSQEETLDEIKTQLEYHFNNQLPK